MQNMQKEKQERKKYSNAMINKLPQKNHRYYVLDSESIGLRIHVELNGAKSFHLQRYVSQFKYSKRTKLGDFPDMSITEARKLAAKVKAANVQGKDPLLAKAALQKEKKLGDVVEEWICKGAYVTNAEFGSGDCTSSTPMEISLTIAMEYAILNY